MSANVTPASPMNTWTADRTFAPTKSNIHQQKTSFLLMNRRINSYLGGYPFCRACIHA